MDIKFPLHKQSEEPKKCFKSRRFGTFKFMVYKVSLLYSPFGSYKKLC